MTVQTYRPSSDLGVAEQGLREIHRLAERFAVAHPTVIRIRTIAEETLEAMGAPLELDRAEKSA